MKTYQQSFSKKKTSTYLLFSIFIGLLFLHTTSYSQNSIVDETTNFILEYNGKVTYSNRSIEYKEPLFKKNYLKINDTKFSLESVQFYKTGEMFYGNIMDPNYPSSAGFAQRIIKGKINLYEKTTLNTGYTYGTSIGGGTSTPMMTSTITKKNYYNIGYENLKKTKYKYLINDLSDNPVSVIKLEKYNSVRKKETLFYVIGTALAVGGLFTSFEITGETQSSLNFETGSFEETDVHKLKPVNLTIGLVGLGINLVNYLINRDKFKYIESAIYIYNE
jgi:hypothetical protein